MAYSPAFGSEGNSVPILAYHRFGPEVADGMTVRSAVFESHLNWILDHGYEVIALRELIAHFFKKNLPLPPRRVVITADDGHKSVYTDLFPLARKHGAHVTLFLYPSALSNASYALTWSQLREMKASGLFDFQSHTYWHPNFKKEKGRLSAEEYERFVDFQIKKSKVRLEQELGVNVDMLAWPFGIFDSWLMTKAEEANYTAAFTIERRHATRADPIMALPRYLMTDSDRGRAFERIITGLTPKED